MLERAMLRTPEAAAYLGLSAATLAKWRVVGSGPRFHKLGRVVVYDPADLRAWLDDRTRRSTAENAAREAFNRALREVRAASRS